MQLIESCESELFFIHSIEFREETIYFIVVDRFADGDDHNDEGPNPALYDPTRQNWVNIGEVIYKELSIN